MSHEEAASQLIRRCRAGEERARAELFDRYQTYLHILAQAQLGRHLRTKCDPSDIVQQTMLEAHRDFASFHGNQEGELLAWLRRILAHNLFNETRHFAAQQRDAAREVSFEQMRTDIDRSSLALTQCLAANTPSPSQLAEQRESAVRVAQALAHLPQDYQTVLLLRIFEGLSSEEAAQRMQRSPGAVRMLQMRALTALRQEMEE
jgi:RNA polymerase sigma-70 factor (ECF subfamily)